MLFVIVFVYYCRQSGSIAVAPLSQCFEVTARAEDAMLTHGRVSVTKYIKYVVSTQCMRVLPASVPDALPTS